MLHAGHPASHSQPSQRGGAPSMGAAPGTDNVPQCTAQWKPNRVSLGSWCGETRSRDCSWGVTPGRTAGFVWGASFYFCQHPPCLHRAAMGPQHTHTHKHTLVPLKPKHKQQECPIWCKEGNDPRFKSSSCEGFMRRLFQIVTQLGRYGRQSEMFLENPEIHTACAQLWRCCSKSVTPQVIPLKLSTLGFMFIQNSPQDWQHNVKHNLKLEKWKQRIIWKERVEPGKIKPFSAACKWEAVDSSDYGSFAVI